MLMRISRMKRTVFLLAICQALLVTGNVVLISTAALLGLGLSARPALATLPVAVYFLAIMLTTIPASFLMQRIGRRLGFALGALIGTVGSGLAAFAVTGRSFALFCAGAGLLGVFNGFGNYYRFAAAEASTDDYRSRAISYVMAGGVVAAFAGANLANWTRNLFEGVEFAGSYMALIGICGFAVVISLLLGLGKPSAEEFADTGRPLLTIASQPDFVVAALGAMLGFGIMVLLMTATPLAMKTHFHTFGETAFVIQWHVLGMFAPAFFTGHLIRRFGVLNIMFAGSLLAGFSVAVNMMGTQVINFWLALVALGVAWNFLFVGGTTLLTETYHPEERAKTQAMNDFLVFTTVTVASLSAGVLLSRFSWRAVNLGVIPAVAVIMVSVLWLKYKRAEA